MNFSDVEMKYENEILAMEQQDRLNPPPKDGIVFIGSSTIRRWTTLAEDFAGMPVVNRGFGGAWHGHIVKYTPRMVVPLNPRAVVVQTCGHDIYNGATPDEVIERIEKYFAYVRQLLPQTIIVLPALKPSLARWSFMDNFKAVNRMAPELVRRTPLTKFVDIWTPLCAAGEPPPKSLYIEDGEHFNAEGYAILTRTLRPVLQTIYSQR
jgi:lysophospholipase L1-like esterase